MQEFLTNASRQIQALLAPPSLLQLCAMLVAVLLGWVTGRLVRDSRFSRALVARTGVRARVYEAFVLTSPILAGTVAIAAIAGVLHLFKGPTAIIDMALKLAVLLFLIRLATYLLRLALGDRTKGWGNTITLIVWSLCALDMLGWLDPIVSVLDGIGIKAGSSRLTVWSALKVLFTVGVFILIAITIARWIERRLMAAHAMAINMRIGIAKFAQAFLVGLSIMLGLNASGLDLTTLNVLTGAIGIGLGFGLQAIASNFVSGFVLLMDRSIKPGDVISFTGTMGTTTEGFGWVQELRGRYVVVRDRDGVETLVPNQHLITNPVINWSYTDPRVRLKLPVRVSYRDDPEVVMKLLTQAADGHARILRDPAPVARLMNFGESGFELELRFWISDPQEGVNNVRSDVNRAIWRLFRDHGITIPVPQREVAFEAKRARDIDLPHGPEARDP
jgi:small-conductance mechanosensitive channel